MSENGFASFAELPPEADELFRRAERRSFFNSREWFEVLAETTLGPDERLRIIAVRGAEGRISGLLPGVLRRRGRPWDAVLLSGLANFYSCRFGPLVADDRALDELVVGTLGLSPDGLHLTTLDRDEDFDRLVGALRTAGLHPLPYFHFGNWYEPVAGRSFAEYWADRPGPLRSTVRRKANRLGRSAEYRLVTLGDDVPWALDAYEKVYASSWKAPEPHPEFIPALVRRAARCGVLRLGVLSLDGQPAAAQIWLVAGGRATIFKLAHDERHHELSPGSVLTMRMMQDVIERDRPVEIDFGRGDDPYKRLWLSQRRERWGILALNPRTPRGALGIGAQGARALARRGLRAVGR